MEFKISWLYLLLCLYVSYTIMDVVILPICFIYCLIYTSEISYWLIAVVILVNIILILMLKFWCLIIFILEIRMFKFKRNKAVKLNCVFLKSFLICFFSLKAIVQSSPVDLKLCMSIKLRYTTYGLTFPQF